MTMQTARTRIGHVALKAGGADVRVLHQSRGSRSLQHLREAFAGLAERGDLDAYALVAFWFDPEDPGHPSYAVNMCSQHDWQPEEDA